MDPQMISKGAQNHFHEAMHWPQSLKAYPTCHE